MTRRRLGREDAWVILLAAGCAVLTLLPVAIRGQGFLTLGNDFDWQQIPFSIALHHEIEQGNLSGWMWNMDLGGSVIQTTSFYALGSPFFWFYMLFPAQSFPYIAIGLFALKYVVAAWTAYRYLCRFARQKSSAMVGALLYAFSGFQAMNLLFFHFHDVVALFPLLLLGVEELAEHPDRKGLMVFAVFLNCATNYFFFVQNVIFLVLYFLFRFGTRDWKALLRKGLNCLLCGLWGTAMAAVLFLPSVLYILQSPRAQQGSFDWLVWPRFFLYQLRGIFLPAEAMNAQSAIFPVEWRSVNAYLPLMGCALAVVYLAKERSWLSGLLACLLVISLSPKLSAAFYLFTDWYDRWWQALALMGALASVRAMDQPERYRLRVGWIAQLLIQGTLLAMLLWLPLQQEEEPLVYDQGKLLRTVLLGAAGTLATAWMVRKGRMDHRKLLCGVCVFAVLTTGMAAWEYGSSAWTDEDRVQIKVGMELKPLDEQYRYAGGSNLLNLPGGAAGTSAFSSTVSVGSREFDALFEYESTNQTLEKLSVAWLHELLGAKYVVTEGADHPDALQTIHVEGRTFQVGTREACPIGFAVDQYLLREELMALPREKRGQALLRAAVIDPDQEEQVAQVCVHADRAELLAGDPAEQVVHNQTRAVRAFTRDGRGFRCLWSDEAPAALYFSVPYDRGWTVWVDGEETEIIPSGGMMLLPVPVGEHQITFTYVTPGVRIGLWISLAAWATFVIFRVLRLIRFYSRRIRWAFLSD